MLNHDYIGTEHLLLGLVRERDGVAGKALASLGISVEAVRRQIEEIVGQGRAAPTGHIPFTPRAKKVLELSLREALQLGHNYIGTEHILLGLIREGEGVAMQVLIKLGADPHRVRETVIQLISGWTEAAASSGGEEIGASAETVGASTLHILVREILPNCVPSILTKMTLDLGFVILIASSLSFLGLGVQPPTPDLGSMVADGAKYLPDSWWLTVFPGLAILVAVFGFNLVGDALREILGADQ